MSKKPAKTPVTLLHPQTYVFSHLANRISIERDADFTLAHFGLLSRTGLLLDRFSCVLPDYVLRGLKENLVQYSDKIGLPKFQSPAWTPPILAQDLGLPVIDFLHVSYGEEHAEICFWSYSEGQMADLSLPGQKQKQMTPWGVALLRCGLDLQRDFLFRLYEDLT
jgi:hypothetical protein